MRAILNKQSLEWLQDHRIFFNRRGGRRLRPGDTLDYLGTAQIEPYAGFLTAFDRRKPDLEPYRPTPARMSDMPFDN